MPASEARAVGQRPVTVALVNNMPDAAFVDTEEQFRRVVDGDASVAAVDLRLYAIDDVPRSEDMRAMIRSRYRDLDEIWEEPPDALIVTGTEPAQAQLPYEPYWPMLARLLEWAVASVPTTMLSCLAAHAATLLFDGIERVPRAAKCCGVFAGAVEARDDPLAAGLPDVMHVPHSRVNDVPEEPMVSAGYRIVVGSAADAGGWAVATRNYRESMLVLCQGHPEYSTLSLLREYRRDVRRFLLGRGAFPYPRLPEGYLSAAAAALLERFAEEAQSRRGEPSELWERFPFDAVAAGVDNTWAGPSATLYANWLGIARALPAGTAANA